MRNLLLFLFLLPCSLWAQLPGTWERTILCLQCSEPAAMDFYDASNGIVINNSKYLGPGKGSIWFSYRTTDSGKNWTLLADSTSAGIYGATIGGPKPIKYFTSGAISIFTGGRHVYSLDSGISWNIAALPRDDQRAVYISDIATHHQVSTPYVSGGYITKIQVSYDSGYTYETTETLFIDSLHGFWKACFADSNDIWVAIGTRDTVQPELLYHSQDGGRLWEIIYPYGEPAAWAFSAFAIDGIIPGANKGTIYLLGNKLRTPAYGRKYFNILYTTDNGQTWTGDSTNIDTTEALGNIFLTRYLYNPAGTQLWSVLWDNKTVAYSPNNGKNWYYDSTTFKNENISFMVWKDSMQGYLLTYTDSIINFYKYIPPQGAVEKLPNPGMKGYFTLYPTVTSSNSLTIGSLRQLGGSFELYDVLGRHYLSKAVALVAKETLQLNLPDMPPGVYFLTLRADGEAITARFVKQ